MYVAGAVCGCLGRYTICGCDMWATWCPSAQPYSHHSPLSMVLTTHLATSLISAPPAARDWGCAACDAHVMCLQRTPTPPAPLYHVISVCASCLMCRALPPAAPPVSTHPQHLQHHVTSFYAPCPVSPMLRAPWYGGLCTIACGPYGGLCTMVWGPGYHGMGACAPWPLCPVPPAPNTRDIQGGMEGVEGTGGHRRPWDGCYCQLEQCKVRHEPNFILTQGVFCWALIKMLLYILHIRSKPTVPHNCTTLVIMS